MIKRVHRIRYFRKDGTYVKPTSMRVKTSAQSVPKSSGLRRYGYNIKSSLKERLNALLRALIGGHSKTSLIRRLGTVAVLTKRSHPTSSLKYRMDKHWLSKI
jgi:hypothetical protein